MKNLITLTHRIGSFLSREQQEQQRSHIRTIIASTINSPVYTIYLVTDDHTLIAYHLQQACLIFTVSLSGDESDMTCIPLNDKIISLQYINESESLHIATHQGQLLLFHTVSHDVTLIGTMTAGILACSWSPDRELLVIITGDYHLMLMTIEGDVLYDVLIDDQGEGVLPNQVMPMIRTERDMEREAAAGGVSISWRGDGQYFTINIYDSRYDYRRLHIYNRHAEHSSQSYPFPASTSTSIAGISPLVSWRPSGNLITSSQRRIIGNILKHEIIFFERNGLRHGEFLLRQTEIQNNHQPNTATHNTTGSNKPFVSSKASTLKRKVKRDEDDELDDEAMMAESFDETEQISCTSSSAADVDIIDMSWNISSDLLALLVYHKSAIRPSYSVQLWWMNNYHWYLKQELCIDHHNKISSAASLSMCWNPESPLSLVLISSTGSIHSFTFAWDVHVSYTAARWCAVIDGSSLLLTPLARNIVPPPMSFSSILLPSSSSVSAISMPEDPAFRPPSSYADRLGFRKETSSTTPLAILTSDQYIHILPDIDTIKRSLTPISLTSLSHRSLSLSSCGYPINHLRLMEMIPIEWNNTAAGYRIIGINGISGSDIYDEVIELIVDQQSQQVQTMFRTPLPNHKMVLRLYPHYHRHCIYVQSDDGQIFKYHSPHTNDPSSISTLTPFSQLPSPSPWFGITEMADTITVVARDDRSRLYCDSTLLTPQCSSFSLSHAAFLIFTIAGSQNALFFVDLQKTLAENMSPEVRSDPHSVRLVEKGSMIITVTPAVQTPRIILQIPRGNLEVIYPRALTISSINLALSQHDYYAAFHTMRTNRIDMNLLYDHDPLDFLLHSEEMVEQIKEIDHLNLFLSALVDRDIKKEEFPNYKAIVSQTKHDGNHDQDEDARDGDVVNYRRKKLNDDANDLARLQAGLSVQHNDTGIARGQRLHADRKAREKAAIEYDARLEQSSSLLSSSTTEASLLQLIKQKNKVNLICDHMRDIFIHLDPSYYTLCILTTYVKKTPPDLESALRLIKQMRDSNNNNILTSGLDNMVSQGKKENKSLGIFAGAEGALKYVIFLCDVEALYRVALGMYDKELVLLVAQHSKKDPKEYLPFLSSLFSQSTTAHYMHYEIDLYLKLYEKALIDLIAAIDAGEVNGVDKWPQVMQLITSKHLWDIALQHCTPTTLPIDPRRAALRRGEYDRWGKVEYDLKTPSGRYLSLLNAYATYLRSLRMPAKAAAAYVLSHDYDAAIVAYKECGDWRSALSLAYSLYFSHTAIHTLAYSFVTLLRESSHHARDAGHLLLTYDEDVDEALVILCKGEEWEEALRIAYMYSRADLVESDILPELRKAVDRMIKSLERRYERYDYAVKRLRIIRRAKLMYSSSIQLQTRTAAEHREADIDDDLLSIVSGVTGLEQSSAASVMSGIDESLSSSVSITSTASASSIFSVVSNSNPSSPTLTPDEKRQQRHGDRLRRKHHKRKVKEGSSGEDAELCSLVREMRLNDRLQEKCGDMIRLCMNRGWSDEAVKIQLAMHRLLTLMQQQESKPMPMMPDMTAEQERALQKYWNWPQNVQCEEKKEKRDEDTYMLPFLAYAQKATNKQVHTTDITDMQEQTKERTTSLSDKQKSSQDHTSRNNGNITEGKDDEDQDGVLGTMI